MPKLIKLHGDSPANYHADWSNNAYVTVLDDEAIPASGAVILPLVRFQAEGAALLDDGRSVGVLLQAGEAVEDLAYDLPRLALVALAFPKYRDGRAYSSARLLRDRYGFGGEIRAVGDVLREVGGHMIRCGFDAFEPADESTPQEWLAVAHRYHHIYQRGADARQPASVERGRV
jgi:uncharacterized protein (DUF934 family)